MGKFSAMAAKWWDPQGPMGPLHSMNPIRVRFCRQAICDAKRRARLSMTTLAGSLYYNVIFITLTLLWALQAE